MSASSGNVLFCLGLILLASSLSEAKGSPYRRQRRSLAQLSGMVNDITGRQSTDFISYGNWCGLGGSGRAVDIIDECCHMHDLCYNLASRGWCSAMGEKITYQVEYKWRKESDGNAACDEDPDKCTSMVCTCDTMLTNCLKENLAVYDPKNLHKLSYYELMKEANWVSNP